jgi:hypothetical protein
VVLLLLFATKKPKQKKKKKTKSSCGRPQLLIIKTCTQKLHHRSVESKT